MKDDDRDELWAELRQDENLREEVKEKMKEEDPDELWAELKEDEDVLGNSRNSSRKMWIFERRSKRRSARRSARRSSIPLFRLLSATSKKFN